VRVLCSRGRYLEGRGGAPTRETRAGVEIRRVRATSFGKRRTLGRLLDYASFHALAGQRAATSRWPDVVVTLTTPPLVGWCGAVAARLSGAAHVNYLMDLHPDAELEAGVLRRGSLAGRLCERVAAFALRRAARNVVLGPYQGERAVRAGAARDSLVEIGVWSDRREIAPVPRAANPVRERMGWSDRFVVMYSGNAGVVHAFDELLGAAKLLADTDPDVLFAFVGGGPRTAEVRDFVRREGLANVELHGYVPREELAASLSAADAHFLSLRPEHVGVAVPGKLYGILASARPVLFVGAERCEPADAVRASGAGWAFPPGSAEELAREIRKLRDAPGLCSELGRRGRDWFLAHHEREACCEAWRRLLEEVADGARRRPAARPRVALGAVDDPPAALPRSAAPQPRHEVEA